MGDHVRCSRIRAPYHDVVRVDVETHPVGSGVVPDASTPMRLPRTAPPPVSAANHTAVPLFPEITFPSSASEMPSALVPITVPLPGLCVLIPLVFWLCGRPVRGSSGTRDVRADEVIGDAVIVTPNLDGELPPGDHVVLVRVVHSITVRTDDVVIAGDPGSPLPPVSAPAAPA